MKDKYIPEGTEVLIFRHIRQLGINDDCTKFTRGIIEKIQEMEIKTNPEESDYDYFYTVLGEDGQHYFGTYGKGTIGGSFFRTPEDHITHLESKIQKNRTQITSLKNENERYLEVMADLYADILGKEENQEKKNSSQK